MNNGITCIMMCITFIQVTFIVAVDAFLYRKNKYLQQMLYSFHRQFDILIL